MSNVLVDFRSVDNPNCGLGQFSIYLGRELSKEVSKESGLDLIYLLPKDKREYFNGVKFENTSFWKRNIYYKYIKFLNLYKDKFDLWHMSEQSTQFYPLNNAPMIFTIHDLNFLREKSDRKIAKRLKELQKRVDRATVITTISNYVKDEIKNYTDLKGKDIQVIYNGLNRSDTNEKKPDSKIVEKEFLFTIGQVMRKKNFHVLIDFIKKTPYNLVIAGDKTTNYAKSIQKRIVDESLDDKVVLLGAVSEEEKKWLYKNTKAFLFPSLTEGFGLPVIEAMSYGKPTFISNLTSLPEIGGDYAFYFDDFKAENMISVFNSSMEIVKNDKNFSDKIKEYSKKFSWTNSAESYVKLYKEILDAK